MGAHSRSISVKGWPSLVAIDFRSRFIVAMQWFWSYLLSPRRAVDHGEM
jgi:hypothetical protein